MYKRQGGQFTDFDNNDGLIQALAGSEVQFVGHVDIFGGTLAAIGSGVLRNQNNTALRLADVVVDGDLIVDDGNTHFVGEIENRQNMLFNGKTLLLDSDITLTGGGSITLSDSTSGATSSINGSGGTHNLNIVNQTIEGFGSMSSNNLNIVNQESGLIDANVDGETLTINPAQVGNVDQFQNEGILRASNGGTMNIIDFENNLSLIHI